MRGMLYLAWQYLRYHPVRTGVLVLCLTATVFLPVGLHLLIGHYERDLAQRARVAPMVLGAKGHRFDLAMNVMYYRTNVREWISVADRRAVRDTRLARTFPVFACHTARGVPVVGTTLDYMAYRGLDVAAGGMPAQLGEAVLGARAAARLGLGPGDALLSDQSNLYNLAAKYPLKLHVVGVLAPSGTVDDDAIFTDVKTTWVIEGIVHGHADLTREEQRGNVAARDAGNVVATANVTAFVEVTPENVGTFHMHASPDRLPLTGVICVPRDDKAEVLLRARYSVAEDLQLLMTADVVDELMNVVFKVETFMQASFALVAVTTSLLMLLIVLLSARLRHHEMENLRLIGCGRALIVGMQLAEWGFVVIASGAMTLAAVGCALWAAPTFGGWY